MWRRLIPGMATGAETPRCMTYAMLRNSQKEGPGVSLSTEGKLGRCIEILQGSKVRFRQARCSKVKITMGERVNKLINYRQRKDGEEKYLKGKFRCRSR